MKNQLLTLIALLGLVALPAFAESKGKEITVKGEAQCAKCNLKTATECQTVIISEKDGKKTTYYLAKNAVSEKFHEEVCKAPHAAAVTAVSFFRAQVPRSLLASRPSLKPTHARSQWRRP